MLSKGGFIIYIESHKIEYTKHQRQNLKNYNRKSLICKLFQKLMYTHLIHNMSLRFFNQLCLYFKKIISSGQESTQCNGGSSLTTLSSCLQHNPVESQRLSKLSVLSYMDLSVILYLLEAYATT